MDPGLRVAGRMTNRELLELAAKAAGIDVFWHAGWNSLALKRNNQAWNPLTDDGDAFRLAVKLHLLYGINDDILNHYLAIEFSLDDPYAATRRAIVMAAAEVGKRI